MPKNERSTSLFAFDPVLVMAALNVMLLRPKPETVLVTEHEWEEPNFNSIDWEIRIAVSNYPELFTGLTMW